MLLYLKQIKSYMAPSICDKNYFHKLGLFKCHGIYEE